MRLMPGGSKHSTSKQRALHCPRSGCLSRIQRCPRETRNFRGARRRNFSKKQAGETDAAYSRCIGRGSRVGTPARNTLYALERCRVMRAMALLAVDLAEYHAGHGTYPESLKGRSAERFARSIFRQGHFIHRRRGRFHALERSAATAKTTAEKATTSSSTRGSEANFLPAACRATVLCVQRSCDDRRPPRHQSSIVNANALSASLTLCTR